MAEQYVVIAILLPVGETDAAIAAGRARRKILRPQLREFQAVLPADHARLIGELAKLRLIGVLTDIFRHRVSNFEMQRDSVRGERLLDHCEWIVAAGVGRGEQIFLGRIA